MWSNDPRGLYLAVNGNCSVYRLDVRSGEVALVLSDTYARRPHEYEMEGITFWDLRKTGGHDLGEREREKEACLSLSHSPHHDAACCMYVLYYTPCSDECNLRRYHRQV